MTNQRICFVISPQTSAEMTKTDLRDFVYELANPNVLAEVMNDIDEWFIRIPKWVRTAHPEYLDWLIALINDPPPNDPKVDTDRWNYTISLILEAWAELDPDAILPKLGKLLEQPACRLTALDAFAGLRNPATIPYLTPLVCRAEAFSEEELLMLIDALGESDSLERHSLLLAIKARTSPTMEEVMQELALYGVTDEAGSPDKTL